ncbi:MAG: sigma factor-like helix-turn-helix DNA-binding protein [Candidatus Merdivicinus sp.]
MEWIAAKDVELPSETADNLLDSIENSQLFQVLQSADKHTLQIILLKLEGYSSREIARLLGIDEYAVNMRIYRLRKKLKKYF